MRNNQIARFATIGNGLPSETADTNRTRAWLIDWVESELAILRWRHDRKVEIAKQRRERRRRLHDREVEIAVRRRDARRTPQGKPRPSAAEPAVFASDSDRIS